MIPLPVIVAHEAGADVTLYDDLLDIDTLEILLRLVSLDLTTTLYYTEALEDP